MIRGNNASVLLLEDEALIAVDMEACLRDVGFSIAGSFSSCATALEWLEMGKPDVVLVDIKLRDGVCVEVARALLACGIPFVVYSGMSFDPEVDDGVFVGVRWISKPSRPARVIEHLAAAIVDHRNDTHSNAADGSLSTRGNADANEDQPVSVPKKRIQLSKAQKRAQMEEATRFTFQDNERRRINNALKTARLRALRLSKDGHVASLPS